MVTAGPDPAPLEVADPTLLLDVRVDPPALNEAFASATSASISVVGEAGAAPSKAASRNVLALSIAIAMVSILAGSALFFSGYSLGRAASADPGTPGADATAFQPFWDTYHTIRDRYAGAEVDQATIISGAIRGMIQSLNDPISPIFARTTTSRASSASTASSRASVPRSPAKHPMARRAVHRSGRRGGSPRTRRTHA